MVGQQLPVQKVLELLDDAKESGVELVRLYGGEPLLHPGLPRMIEHAANIGLSVYVTTNGILLKQKIDELFSAGLRNLSVGFYGSADDYNKYTQKTDAFRRLTEGLAFARARYGNNISLQLNYLICVLLAASQQCELLGTLQNAMTWHFTQTSSIIRCPISLKARMESFNLAQEMG
jgi:cyclic pyranopterin phosphate synthase